MSIDDVPVLAWILDTGPDDRVFDSLLLAGPLLIVVLALVGRSPVTVALAVGYLGVFAGYTLYKWAT